jgi:hypothetical protein
VTGAASCLLARRWGHFYDTLVFSKIRAKLGGEVKYMTTGACGIRAGRGQQLKQAAGLHSVGRWGCELHKLAAGTRGVHAPPLRLLEWPLPSCTLCTCRRIAHQ